jgi:F0F1-type ATP synthase gamma subunit
MKNANDNAVSIIKELNLQYNKTRQEKITNEISDIASATLFG